VQRAPVEFIELLECCGLHAAARVTFSEDGVPLAAVQ